MVANPHLPVLLDLLGVFAAAVAGAFVGLRKGLDLVGILVIAVASSLGGGMTRDALIGATPVAAISDWRYFAVALAATSVVLVLTNRQTSDSKLRSAMEEVRIRAARAVRFDRIAVVADALTLGLFAVSGTLKALDYHLPVFQAALLGTVTATGGGVLRDVLVNEVPLVLQRELYAVPAFLGGLLFAEIERHGFVVQGYPASVVSVFLTAAVRLVAVWKDWHAPRPGAVA
ncbi:MAG: hypothetical protein AUG49_03630 [Catenulispora sp. 13_1_20CM_3_70_7]|jgi:uncharacterized membrane protein YeiH|nr:TRIC cation channel family protein [Catenulisporales bacterium]OLE28028.1 MAG: hypothetical protein AUG49_03630 [Catenulispora sp. 13_1_20CM_3_70_7]